MSDQTLCVGYWNANYEEWEDVRPASPADLLAALVKAVEEGTIEGAEMMTSNVSGGFVQLAGSVAMDERGPGVDYLVVPVREGPNQ